MANVSSFDKKADSENRHPKLELKSCTSNLCINPTKNYCVPMLGSGIPIMRKPIMVLTLWSLWSSKEDRQESKDLLNKNEEPETSA